MKFEEALFYAKDLDISSINKAKERFRHIAKPINGLGILEKNFVRIAGMQKTSNININKKALAVVCSDNGVVKKGVSQTGQEVTSIVARQIAEGKTIVCKMADCANTDIFVIDVGMIKDSNHKNIIRKKTAYSTNDISEKPAMTKIQAIKTIETGIEIVKDLKSQNYNIILTGEMGIGNTTTSSACASVLLNESVEKVTGKGAGLSDKMLKRKIEIIKKAIEINKPESDNPIDILHKLGGFDIAAMSGIFIGGAVYNIPIVIDGFISSVSAVIAGRICPKCINYMLASHCSDEPASKSLLKELNLQPVIYAQMCLGEGTGAVSVMPVYDMTAKIYNEMGNFSDMNIEEYKDYDES